MDSQELSRLKKQIEDKQRQIDQNEGALNSAYEEMKEAGYESLLHMEQEKERLENEKEELEEKAETVAKRAREKLDEMEETEEDE